MPDNSLCKKGIFEDLRQASIVSRYELLKYFSGYKLLIFAIIVAVALLLVTVTCFIFQDGSSVNGIYSAYISVVMLLALLGVALFTSPTICSEFEDRTALVLFTKPIKKSTIFLGKIVIGFALNIVMFAIYYLVAMLVGLVITGDVSMNLWTSFGYLVAYIFALTGIAVMFSSLMKRSSSASILTFIFVLFVPSLVLVVVALSQGATDNAGYWYFLDVAASSISSSISGTVANGLRDVLTMIVWGLIPMIIGYLRFAKREL